MAKKARKKPESRETGSLSLGLLKQVYPTIADWAAGYGWVEFGIDGRDRPFVRALDEGGTVWEGEERYESLDEALRAMEAGLGEFMEAEGFNRGRGGGTRKKPLATPGSKPTPRKRSSPKGPARQTHDDQVKADVIPAVPRAIVEKVRKFDEIAEALRQGQHFEITRLTSLKGLCKEPRAAWRFALFLAGQAGKKIAQAECPERDKALAAQAVSAMETYMEKPSPERGSRLSSMLREVEAEQDESRRVGWNQVRMIRNRDLLVIENALRSVVFIAEAPTWLYQAARDYAERYDSRHGTGLIPSSAPMMQDIADFWLDYFGIGG